MCRQFHISMNILWRQKPNRGGSFQTPRNRLFESLAKIGRILWQAKVDKNEVFSNITNSFSNITNSFSNITNSFINITNSFSNITN